MQLKRGIRQALAAASGALLASAPAQADIDLLPGDASDWSFDSAILVYQEADRVRAIEPVAQAKRDLGDEEYLTLRLTVDSLTGASANGAAPASVPQTFTSPSGGSTYTIAPGETPLDPTFKDLRAAMNVSWDRPLGRDYKLTLGGNASLEYDYRSVALSATLAHDLNLKNTTLSVGVSVGTDISNPVGGTPVPLTSVPTQPWACDDDPGVCATPPARLASDQDKSLSDVLLGFTQVLSPRALLQVNYSWGSASGYLTDPYKMVSVVDGAPGPNQGDPLDHLYEQRPDSRTKQALYAQYRRMNASGNSWDVSLRHLWDDWGVVSETLDAHYRWRIGGHDYLQPHLRWYQQSAADFYTPFLVAGDPLPAAATGDYRLADMTTSTLGLKYGHELAKGREFGVQLELYRQSGDSQPPGTIGVLQGYDLFPVVTATMIQVGFTF